MVYNPVNPLNDAIATQYARIRRLWESKTGHSIYKLSTPLGLLGFGTFLTGAAFGLRGMHKSFDGDPREMIFGMDIIMNLVGLAGYYDRLDYTTGETTQVNFRFRLASKVFALPTFVYSTVYSSIGVYNFVNSIANRTHNDFIGYLVEGVSYLALASSMYLKFADPKLLKKQPSKLKAAIEKLTSRIKSLIPKPVPSPQPTFQSTYEQMLYSI